MQTRETIIIYQNNNIYIYKTYYISHQIKTVIERNRKKDLRGEKNGGNNDVPRNRPARQREACATLWRA